MTTRMLIEKHQQPGVLGRVLDEGRRCLHTTSLARRDSTQIARGF